MLKISEKSFLKVGHSAYNVKKEKKTFKNIKETVKYPQLNTNTH